MVVKKIECYVPYCDVCKQAHEGDYTVHYDTEAAALEDIQDHDWWVWEGHIWCLNCLPPCVCGHLFGEHDYGGSSCEDCPCKGYSPKPESKEANA